MPLNKTTTRESEMQKPRISWHRPYIDTETGRPIYEDNMGRFEIRYRPADDSGYGACWYIQETDGSPCELEPRTYLEDAKRAAEGAIFENEVREVDGPL